MAKPLTRQAISDAVDPLGWRLILGVLVTHVPVPTLAAAVDALGVAVAAGGTGVDEHLRADVHPDRVVLHLRRTDAGWLTPRDVELAAQVTEALAGHGLDTQPGVGGVPPQTLEIAIDALDIALITPFWRAVTGYVDDAAPDGETPGGDLLDPLRRGPAIWFQQMDEPRTQRNRIHLDVDVPPELAGPRVDAALAAGGTLVSDAAAPAFWVLADPEGNEVCICTWQGRD
ncbi:VOC family protein [Mycobacterium yunnanensis]|uniref:VOC family protein n=1 Tax=Mycobacterium yunnanensis TaxID=368477 RepID=A0A9X3C3Q2_9MYCO|nr:VOC family protein [Mycobacterium yunnanensis]MCV7423366.1 VOC family protein [Mycobacterium yunnanensis]